MYVRDMKVGKCYWLPGLSVVWVGWLGKKVPRRGTVPPAIMEVLRHHRTHSYVEDHQLGCHTCEICGQGEFHGQFVIRVGDTHFHLPVGIFHYIEEHGYCP